MSPSTSPNAEKPFRIVVLLSGRGSNFQALYEAISAGRIPAQIVGVVTDQETARGRTIAEEHSIANRVIPRRPKTLPLEQFNAELRDATASFSPDLVVLAGFMRILTTDFVSAFSDRLINIHPSLLPSFRGLEAQAQALAAGVRFSGCSVHYVVDEVDAGPIIAQGVVPILSTDTPETLSARILTVEHQLLPACVHAIATGQVTATKRGKTLAVSVEQNTLITREQAFMSVPGRGFLS